jgi:hypothetical protein
MSRMVRLGLSIPEDMDTAIKQESRKTLVPVAALVRLALERLLTERGYKLETEVEWGGNRQPEAQEK